MYVLARGCLATILEVDRGMEVTTYKVKTVDGSIFYCTQDEIREVRKLCTI